MRRISLFCLLLCIAFQSYSQVYFTYGYGGSFTNAKGLNQFVENYNARRTWLNTEMKPFSYLDGISVSVGLGFGGGWVDMEYALRARKRFADGIDAAGDDVTRQVKLRQNVFAISTGGMFVEGSGGVAFGLRTEFGNQKNKYPVV
jgi:cell division protein FtsW (lipid II flippase)